jgi:hypothetical protein
MYSSVDLCVCVCIIIEDIRPLGRTFLLVFFVPFSILVSTNLSFIVTWCTLTNFLTFRFLFSVPSPSFFYQYLKFNFLFRYKFEFVHKTRYEFEVFLETTLSHQLISTLSSLHLIGPVPVSVPIPEQQPFSIGNVLVSHRQQS